MSFGHPNTASIPSPQDRTPNDPAVLVESKHIKAYLRSQSQIFSGNADAVAIYTAAARKTGWEDVKVLGASVLLTADVKLG